MKKASNISLLIIFASVLLASCSKAAPLVEKSQSSSAATNDYNPTFQSTAISTANNEHNEGGSGTITDPDHDTDHDRDKTKPKTQ